MSKLGRRKFMEVVIGGITVALSPLSKSVPKTDAPAKTLLGKELTSPKLLPEGWHTVIVKNIEFKPSKLRPEDVNIWFELETVFEPKTKLFKIISPRAPQFALDFIKRLNLLQVHDSVDLTPAVGKQLQVKVNHAEYQNKTVMGVE